MDGVYRRELKHLAGDGACPGEKWCGHKLGNGRALLSAISKEGY